MLDVLITISENTPKEWVEQCLYSVLVASKRAPYAVQAHQVPGVPGHIGRAMKNGLQRTTKNYVCWVDDDDYVLPEAFVCMAHAFSSKPVAVCAREIELYANGSIEVCNSRHHLTAYSTSWAKQFDLELFRAIPNVLLLNSLPEDVIDIPEHVYVRRVRASGALALRATHMQQEMLLCQAY
jgi:hypothetical protein